MSRFFLALLLVVTLPACSSSEKEADVWGETGAGAPPSSDQPASDQPQGDDDSAATSDDDDSAAPPQAAEASKKAATSKPTTAAPAAPSSGSAPLPEYMPPPPGEKGLLERAATLMTGTRFRWVQGSKDVAYGLYGAPVLLNLWSCTDNKIDESLEWLKVMEKTYSDQMLSILVPANVAERSLTGQDNICGRSIRFGRSLGVDVGKGVMSELDVKKLPTTLVFNSQGAVAARKEGPVIIGSGAANTLETALKREMAPLTEGRSQAP